MIVVTHPTTETRLNAIRNNMPQSLLLCGDRGIGLNTIARQLAGHDLMAELRPQNNQEKIDDENGIISVDAVRQLYSQTRAKYTSRQVVILDDADRMSAGAQAAFLKLLEEPNEQIYFILTSHFPQKLLATIRSRVQQTMLHPLTQEQSVNHIVALGVNDPTKQAQLLFIASGLPAELTRLIMDEDHFAELAKIMMDARSFLQADAYEKMVIIQKYQTNRATVIQLIDSTMQILRRTMISKPQQTLVMQLATLLDIRENILNQYNIKLQLMRFVL